MVAVYFCGYVFYGHFRSFLVFFFSSRRRHTRSTRDWSSDVCSSDLGCLHPAADHRIGHFANEFVAHVAAKLVPTVPTHRRSHRQRTSGLRERGRGEPTCCVKEQEHHKPSDGGRACHRLNPRRKSYVTAYVEPSTPHAKVREERKPQKPESAGVATGAPHAPVKDAMSRPITAGGFVDGAPVVFIDITKHAGLDKFRHISGTPEKATILETPGSGVALLDYDNDGWLDIYLLNGSTFAALKGKESAPRAMLLHNNHDGTFTDVTAKAGVTNERWGFGVAVGDYDNDGWPDIYIANFGKNRLYHNNHDGTFTDVAEKAGVALGG